MWRVQRKNERKNFCFHRWKRRASYYLKGFFRNSNSFYKAAYVQLFSDGFSKTLPDWLCWTGSGTLPRSYNPSKSGMLQYSGWIMNTGSIFRHFCSVRLFHCWRGDKFVALFYFVCTHLHPNPTEYFILIEWSSYKFAQFVQTIGTPYKTWTYLNKKCFPADSGEWNNEWSHSLPRHLVKNTAHES